MNHKINLLKILLAVVILFQTVISSGQQRLWEPQIDKIFAELNKPGTPGAAIAIVQDGKTVFKKGYGTADLEFNIPVSNSTVFQVASLSKQVTAFAVLLLESRGALSLDDNVSKFLPEFPEYGKAISLRQLLLHTSGLRDYWGLLSMAGWRYDDIITEKQMLDMIYRQKGLNFRPGYEHVYTNTGYAILAEVVSKVSGMSFADFTGQNIFKPLKMNNTLFLDDNEKVVRNFAGSYWLSPEGYKRSLLNHSVTGSTNLLTTAEDMALWAMNFENPVVGDRDLIRRMDTPGTLNSGDTIPYAMGQETGIYRGLKLLGHRGAERGYRSFIVRFPEQHLSIIIFSNNSSVDPTDPGLQVANIILKDKFPPETVQTPAATALIPDEFTGDTDILKLYAGSYELRPGFIISITSENGRLFAEAHEVPKSVLIRKSPSEFVLSALKAKLTFAGEGATDITKMLVDLNGQQMVAQKLKAFDAASVNPDDFTGDFYSPELGTVYTFINKGGELIATHPRMDSFSLVPTGTDQFSADKGFCDRIEFIRDSGKSVTGCLVSSGRIKNIGFKKIL